MFNRIKLRVLAIAAIASVSISPAVLAGSTPSTTSSDGGPSKFGGPGILACSDVAPGDQFKAVVISQIDPLAPVKTCYLTIKEQFWPTRFGIRSGFLYEVGGVIYRVKDI